MNIQPAVIIFVGVAISVLGFLISGIGALRASQQQDNSVLNLLTKSEEIARKSEEIARLNQELANSVIGGDSFCYLVISNIDSVKNIGIFVVLHRGKHPLYDVHARIVDSGEVFHGRADKHRHSSRHPHPF